MHFFSPTSSIPDLSVPQGVRVQVHGVSLDVEWTPVRNATTYTVVVEEDQDQGGAGAQVLTVNTEFFTASNLKSYTRYCVTLSAKNVFSQSSFSTPVCISTDAPI